MIALIGGFPRSGTREFTDAMNCWKNVSIRGEVYGSTVGAVFSLIQEHDEIFLDNKYTESYHERRAYAALNSIVSLSKTTPSLFSKENFEEGVVGFKTPHIENRWKELEFLFGLDRRDKVYFYCYRKLSSCFLSLSNMGWTGSAEEFSKKSV